jgi:arsenate reductase
MLRQLSLATLTIAAVTITACASHTERPPAAVGTILFVCEHGNVKSLMAASYFNDLARRRGIGVRAISRAAALDSVTVPAPIVAGLKDDGFDVAAFRPIALSAADVAASQRVIVINTALPAGPDVRGKTVESWNDVPAATVDSAAARDSLKAHISGLVAQLQAGGDP